MSIAKSMKFMRDVKSEAGKVTWPSLADTRVMTLMVFVLVVIVSIYLMLVDMAITVSMNWILGV
ncbi:MAG: preprotein translocase subunit SecE [Alphaproteobacteria bacterium]